jgi:CMP-N-acetylneuraminic acid synthetase
MWEARVISNPEIVAFVHAKGTSDRIPGKNLRLLGNQPLFCQAIINALGSRLVDRVVVDSESSEILRLGQVYGAIPLERPAELATNKTTGDDLAYWQASNYPRSRIVLQVVPTSPFLRPESIDRAIEILSELEVDTVVGVFGEPIYEWRDGQPVYFRADGTIPNSSDLRPVIYETTGLYVSRTEFVLSSRRRLNPNSCAPLRLTRIEAIDINTPEDFDLAEAVWRGLNMSGAATRDGERGGHEVRKLD